MKVQGEKKGKHLNVRGEGMTESKEDVREKGWKTGRRKDESLEQGAGERREVRHRWQDGEAEWRWDIREIWEYTAKRRKKGEEGKTFVAQGAVVRFSTTRSAIKHFERQLEVIPAIWSFKRVYDLHNPEESSRPPIRFTQSCKCGIKTQWSYMVTSHGSLRSVHVCTRDVTTGTLLLFE